MTASHAELASITRLREGFASVASYVALPAEDEVTQLRERVCAVVADLKATGMTPERVIITIKAIAYGAGISHAGDRLIRDVVRWCITEYLRE